MTMMRDDQAEVSSFMSVFGLVQRSVFGVEQCLKMLSNERCEDTVESLFSVMVVSPSGALREPHKLS